MKKFILIAKWVFAFIVVASGIAGFYYLKGSFLSWLASLNPLNKLKGLEAAKPGGLIQAQKKYVDGLAKENKRPTIVEMFFMYLGTLNPFRRL